MIPLLAQMARYGLAGSTAALAHLLVLVLLVEFADCQKTLASALGFAAATPINYGLQHRFVFRRRGRHSRFLVRYLGVTGATLGLNTVLFAVLSSGIGVPYLLAQVVTIGVVVLANYTLNRQFTFAQRQPA